MAYNIADDSLVLFTAAIRQNFLANPSNSSPGGSYHYLNFDEFRDKARYIQTNSFQRFPFN